MAYVLWVKNPQFVPAASRELGSSIVEQNFKELEDKMGEKISWLIEDFERDNSFGELVEEVKRQGHAVEVIR